MLRSAVTDVLNRVAGAENGAAMVRPSPARRRVFTIVATVVGIRFINCQGRTANLINPPAAICSGPAPPEPCTGFGGGVSGAALHSCEKRLAPPTPSTAA